MSNIFNATVRHGPGGWTYRYPDTVEPFSFEEADLFWWEKQILSHWKLSLYAGAIYLVTIFGLHHWMKNRPAMNLKTALFWWNTALGVFSIVGCARTAPALLHTLGTPNGFHRMICKKDYMDTPIIFWTMIFSLSKFVELGDTVFIVLRKKPLTFLQWFHHLVTVNFVWILGALLEPISIVAMAVNYAVHSLMYPYFALMGIGVRIPRTLAKLITACQFGQMIFMFVVNVLTTYYYQIGEDCYRHPFSIKGYVMVYGSFVFLFGKLFVDSVIKSSKMKGKQGGKFNDAKNE